MLDFGCRGFAWTLGSDELKRSACDAFTFSEPDDRLYCADSLGVVRGRSLTTGELDGTMVEHQRSSLSSVAVQSVDGHRDLVAFGMQSPIVGRWRIDGGGPISRGVAEGHDWVEYSPDGRLLLVAGPADVPSGFTASVWDPIANRAVWTLTPDFVDVEWLDSKRLVVVTDAGRARVVDLRTGSMPDVSFDIEPGEQFSTRIADGRIAFAYPDGHVDVFDFDAGTQVSTLRRSNDATDSGTPINMVTPSTDGTRLYVMYGYGHGLFVFDVASGRQLQADLDTSSNWVAVARDAPVAISHVDGSVTLHDPDDLSVIATLPGARSYPTVTYDESGSYLVVGGGGTAALYDVARRQRMGEPIEVSNGDASVDLRPDGMELATAGGDKPRVTLWSLDPAVMTMIF